MRQGLMRCVVLCVVLSLSIPYDAKAAETHWGTPAIQKLMSEGIIEESVEPEQILTHEAFRTMLINSLEKNHSTEWPIKLDLMLSEQEDQIEWEEPIQRSTMAAWIGGALDLTPLNGSFLYEDTKELSSFSNGWISAVTETHVLQGVGDNTFAPNRPVTVAETSTALIKVIELQDLTKQIAQTIVSHEEAILDVFVETPLADDRPAFAELEHEVLEHYTKNQLDHWRTIYNNSPGVLLEAARLLPYTAQGIPWTATITEYTPTSLTFQAKVAETAASGAPFGMYNYVMRFDDGIWKIDEITNRTAFISLTAYEAERLVHESIYMEDLQGELTSEGSELNEDGETLYVYGDYVNGEKVAELWVNADTGFLGYSDYEF
ncbi:S-layer homology domain-containing protein [Aureibacillus halotolerans]|uniref:S-layer family protein n=1 Tax=Aureibacillus halotolerans TaxID=1508390 RepID=A0A4R6TVC0_9BACI|nr:S-layer homology domain-containing protein [Aureibacillus halotolerans]TDQ37730.1 S-layer family protein [Aureibacillus halotolerans]